MEDYFDECMNTYFLNLEDKIKERKNKIIEMNYENNDFFCLKHTLKYNRNNLIKELKDFDSYLRQFTDFDEHIVKLRIFLETAKDYVNKEDISNSEYSKFFNSNKKDLLYRVSNYNIIYHQIIEFMNFKEKVYMINAILAPNTKKINEDSKKLGFDIEVFREKFESLRFQSDFIKIN